LHFDWNSNKVSILKISLPSFSKKNKIYNRAKNLSIENYKIDDKV